MKKSIDVSVIIVHYKVKKELFRCLQSIIDFTNKITYQIIVVDNDEEKRIEKDLKKQFPEVIYVPNKNNGWGGGVNVGTAVADGKYLYFLNPDTYLYNDVISEQYKCIIKQKNVGVVAAALVENENEKTSHYGSELLYPKQGIFSLSVVHKFFPKNMISQKFWLFGKKKNTLQEIPVVPLAAAIISKNVFENVGKFDERFFLYFEEYDLAMRLHIHSLKNYLLPQAKVFHSWGVSSKFRTDIEKIYKQSRYTYFRKYFGIFPAIFVEMINAMSRTGILIALILSGSFLLRTYQLSDLMPFFGDQGWFYLSARDMLLTQQIPLVGIASSHPWLHQGSLWTYFLALLLFVSNFNPIFPAFVTCLLDLSVIYFLYKIGCRIFSKSVGIVAALFYGFSPLIIVFARMPYHTSPIPLFSLLLFYYVYIWIHGKAKIFPVIIFLLALLYNFEIATSVFGFVVLIFMCFLTIFKKGLLKATIKPIIITRAAFAGFIIMLPMLIYDVSHGFPQTVKYGAWIGYKILSVLHFIPENNQQVTFVNFLSQISMYIQQLFFLPNTQIAWLIFIGCLIGMIFLIVKDVRDRNYVSPSAFLGVWLVVAIFGIILNKTPSAAYFPMLFPLFSFLVANFLVRLFTTKTRKIFVIFAVFVYVGCNSFYLIKQQYLMAQKNGYGLSFATRMAAVHEIIDRVSDTPFSLRGTGSGSEFESFTMNYEYLLWYNNHASTNNENNIILISESENNYYIQQITRPVIAISH